MKTLVQMKHLKYVKWPVVIGGYIFVIKTLGNVVAQRDAAESHAKTMTAMFGSLAEYVGDEMITSWENNLSNHPEESVPEPVEEEVREEQLEEGEAIEIAAPIVEIDDEEVEVRDDNNG